MKIIIELIESKSTTDDNEQKDGWTGWKVTSGEKYADDLSFDEMIGLITAVTMPQDRPTLHWLKTESEHQQWKDYLNKTGKIIESITQ